jgi:transposase
MIFVGVDWAEAHHDVHVQDADGKRLGRARLPEGVEGIARFHDLVGPFAEEPAEVVVGIETDRGLFVAALVAAGYLVFAVNPLSTSRYRDRHSVSGAKSDPGDAKVLRAGGCDGRCGPCRPASHHLDLVPCSNGEAPRFVAPHADTGRSRSVRS